MTSVDDIWASLQAEDSAARTSSKKKEKKITGTNKKKIKDAPVAPKVEADSGASSEKMASDKEITLENVVQQLHFHIRSIINGNLGERKESLRWIARLIIPTLW